MKGNCMIYRVLKTEEERARAKNLKRKTLDHHVMLCIMLMALSPLPVLANDLVVSNGQTLALGSLTTSDAVLVGNGSAGTLDLGAGSNLVLNTTNESTVSRIEIGNGGSGVLNLSGGSITFNIANGSPATATSIGHIWVGGGANNTSGGSGALNMTSGVIQFVPETVGTPNYGTIAVGEGTGVSGTFNQSGGEVEFQSGGALNVGALGGNGAYVLSGNAVMDAAQGGMTAYIGSGTSDNNGSGATATGSLTISGNAQFAMMPGAQGNNQLFVGDAKSTGSIVQDGSGSVVTLDVANAIQFGSNVNDTGGANGGGTGSYVLSAGTLNVNDVGGSDEMIFGSAAGGTGNFVISGGTANIATQLLVASVAGSTGDIHQTGGTLSLTDGAKLSFGAGNGSYELLGGTLLVGGTNGISGPGAFELGNATLGVQGSNLSSSVNATLLAGTTFTFDTQGFGATWSGVLSGGGNLTKAGAGTLTLTGANTYTGDTTIAGGTLALSGQGSLASSTNLIDNGTFDISVVTAGSGSGPADVAVGSLSGNGTILNGTNALLVGGNNANTSFSGTIINTGDGWDAAYGTFSKVGSGTLTIDGATIEHGESYVMDGTLAQTSGNSAIDYLSVGTGTTGSTPNVGALTVSGGTITFGTGLQVGDWGGTGTVTQTGGTVIVDDGCGDLAHCASLNIGSQGGTGSYNISGGTLAFSSGFFDIGRNTSSNPASHGTLAISGNAIVDVAQSSAMIIGDWLSMGTSGALAGTGVVNQTGGTLAVDGTSRLYLAGSGDGTYNLSGGTLQIGGNSLLGDYNNFGGHYAFNLGGGSIQVIGSALNTSVNANLVNGTTSTIDTNGIGATWNGVLSGQGALAKNGAGTLVLTADNTYGGGTLLNGGTLLVSSDANLGDASGALTFNGGVLENAASFTTSRNINLAGDATFYTDAGTTLIDTAGTIAGTGPINKEGTGTLVLGADDTTGGVNVGAGTLQLTGVSTDTGASNIAAGATLAITGGGSDAGASSINNDGTFDISTATRSQSITGLAGSGVVNLGTQSLALTEASGTYSGVIVGSGGLSIDGGSETLTGINTYSGQTTVMGSLGIDGALANSSVVVGSAGTLSGTGSVAGLVAQSGAVVAPGDHGVGTLTDHGDYSQANGAKLQISVSSGASSTPFVSVDGKANLSQGAVLSLTNTQGWNYAENPSYMVLTAAGGVTGTYVLANNQISAFYQLLASYDANHVYLSADQVRSFADAAQTSNELQTATSLNALPSDSSLRNAVAALPNDAAARAAFNQLSGELYASAHSVLVEQSHLTRDAVSDRLQQTLCNGDDIAGPNNQTHASLDTCATDGVVAWERVLDGSGHQDGNGNASRLDDSVSGVMVGADTRISDNWHVGMLGGYEQSNININAMRDSARSDSYDLGLYGGSRYGSIYVQTGATYAWQTFNTNRPVDFGNFLADNVGRYKANTGQLFGEVGYLSRLGAISLTPFAAAAYINTRSYAFKEAGSVAALDGNSTALNNALSTLGVHALSVFHAGGVTWTVDGSLGWQHIYGKLVPKGDFTYQEGNAFTSAGLPLAHDSAVADVGLSVALKHGLALGASYGGQFGGGIRDNDVRGRLTWTF
ncbi:autotransporter domain-containing protein [Rhodanobacter sp. Si-c]|uniref:Autotransporter domain-containing protein n=1 Tax=Rhodanobacter lycopersici TaxID=3162487 RepID=A0ABV3QJ05_9GAMM